MTDAPETKVAENDAKATVAATESVAVSATTSIIHKLWDDALADAEKGLAWFKAEVAKL